MLAGFAWLIWITVRLGTAFAFSVCLGTLIMLLSIGGLIIWEWLHSL